MAFGNVVSTLLLDSVYESHVSRLNRRVDRVDRSRAATPTATQDQSFDPASGSSRARPQGSSDDAVVLNLKQSTQPEQAQQTPQTYGRDGRLTAPRVRNLAGPSRRATEYSIDENNPQLQVQQERALKQLTSLDKKVREHEQLHKNLLGEHAAGDIQYRLTVGPDGLDYATGGSVPVNLAPAETPEETVKKAQIIQRAALAPDEPSDADFEVATKAAKLESEATKALSRHV